MMGANGAAARAGALAASSLSEKLGVLCARYATRAREALDWYIRTAATAQTLPGDDAAFVRATRTAISAGGGAADGFFSGKVAGAATSVLSDGDYFYGGKGVLVETTPHVLSAGLWAALGLEGGPSHIPLVLADRLAVCALRPPTTFFALLGGAPGARASARASAAAAGVAAFDGSLLSSKSVSRAVAARRVDAMLGAAEVAAAGVERCLEEHEEALETFAWDTSEWCWSERVGGGGDETSLAAALAEASLSFSALPLPGYSVFSPDASAASQVAPLAVLATRLDETARIALAFSVLTPRKRVLRGPPVQDVAAVLARAALRPQLGDLLPPQPAPPLHSHLLDLAAPPSVSGGGGGAEDAARNAPRVTLFPSDGSFIVVTPTEGVAYTGAVSLKRTRSSTHPPSVPQYPSLLSPVCF